MLVGQMKTAEEDKTDPCIIWTFAPKQVQRLSAKSSVKYFHIGHVLVSGSWISIDLPAFNQPPPAHTSRSPWLCSIYSPVTFALTGSARPSTLTTLKLKYKLVNYFCFFFLFFFLRDRVLALDSVLTESVQIYSLFRFLQDFRNLRIPIQFTWWLTDW